MLFKAVFNITSVMSRRLVHLFMPSFNLFYQCFALIFFHNHFTATSHNHRRKRNDHRMIAIMTIKREEIGGQETGIFPFYGNVFNTVKDLWFPCSYSTVVVSRCPQRGWEREREDYVIKWY